MRDDSITEEVLGLFKESQAILERCKSHCDLKFAYPADEVQWLLSEAWDRGVMLFNVNRLDEGKLFCEMALSLASYTGKTNEERVSV